VDVLIRAWPEVVKQAAAVRLLILADGPERHALVTLTQQLGVAEQILFAGEVPHSEVASYLAASEVFVLPSRHEGMSCALLEAMAAGRACLASDIRANREVIQPGVNGLLFKTENASDLAARLAELLEDEALRARLGEAALRTVVERYSIEVVARQYLRLYEALIENRPLHTALAAPVEPSSVQE